MIINPAIKWCDCECGVTSSCSIGSLAVTIGRFILEVIQKDSQIYSYLGVEIE